MGSLPGVQVLKVCPKEWGVHVLDVVWAYHVLFPGDMHDYRFPSKALVDIEAFKPDIIMVQNEAYCAVSHQMYAVARHLECKFILFVWENIRPYTSVMDQELLKRANLVVCGNGQAEHLVRPWNTNTLHCIQVGVNTDVFKPIEEARYDVIYQGRLTPEKGVDVLRRAVQGTEWKVLWPEPNFGTPYPELPRRYAKARVYAAPSIDTELWREQHAGYSSLEALSCGLYVATSDSEAIVEALMGCPGVEFSRQGDWLSLREGIKRLLENKERNLAGREWVIEHYGYKAIADRLLNAFRGLS